MKQTGIDEDWCAVLSKRIGSHFVKNFLLSLLAESRIKRKNWRARQTVSARCKWGKRERWLSERRLTRRDKKSNKTEVGIWFMTRSQTLFTGSDHALGAGAAFLAAAFLPPFLAAFLPPFLPPFLVAVFFALLGAARFAVFAAAFAIEWKNQVRFVSREGKSDCLDNQIDTVDHPVCQWLRHLAHGWG